MSFETAFRFTMGAEGGYSVDPRDPGGETYKGVSRKANPAWPGWHIVDSLKKDSDFHKKLAASDELQRHVMSLYESEYWKAASCDRMPPKIGVAVFDAAVHHGQKTAIKLLQRALKVADDGEYGRITHGTLQSRDTNETLDLLLAQRAIYMTTCPAWPTYKVGWLKRLFSLARSNLA